jgi:hypothetical protein
MDERVVQAHLDVRVRGERCEGVVEALGVRVVEQHAHAHAALGRTPQLLEQQIAGLIGVPDVVLHVEAPLRCGGEEHARGEGVAAEEQAVNAGRAGMRGYGRRNGLPDRRCARIGQRGALGAPFEWRQGDARGETRGQRDDDRGAHSMQCVRRPAIESVTAAAYFHGPPANARLR